MFGDCFPGPWDVLLLRARLAFGLRGLATGMVIWSRHDDGDLGDVLWVFLESLRLAMEEY